MPRSETSILGGVASISREGAIIVGDTIAIDGHHDGTLVRVTTHVHSDHVRGLGRSARSAAVLVATPLTHGLIEAYVRRLPREKRVDLAYDTRISFDGVYITLLRANHVPGAAEVLVEDGEGYRVLYTGDFKLPGTDIVEDLDVLVVDATYGMPWWRRPWQEDMEYLLPDLVREGLMNGPVYIYAYNGKVEEVAVLLRRQGVDAPFIVDVKRYKGLRLIERHGMRVGEVLPRSSREALEVKRDGWFVEFRRFNDWKRGSIGSGLHMLLTGWEFEKPFRRLSSRRMVVSFSDHADFDQLVSYVTQSRPRLLVVDAARGGKAARVFAEYARSRLGLRAVACPGGV